MGCAVRLLTVASMYGEWQPVAARTKVLAASARKRRMRSRVSGCWGLDLAAPVQMKGRNSGVRVGDLSRTRAVRTTPLRLSCKVMGKARTLQVRFCSSGREELSR